MYAEGCNGKINPATPALLTYLLVMESSQEKKHRGKLQKKRKNRKETGPNLEKVSFHSTA